MTTRSAGEITLVGEILGQERKGVIGSGIAVARTSYQGSKKGKEGRRKLNEVRSTKGNGLGLRARVQYIKEDSRGVSELVRVS
jgi:hypothetical protein